MLPSAEPERLGCEEHVLADRRRLAEDVIAGLTLEDRQRQDPFGVEKFALEPALGAGRTKAVAVVDDIEAAALQAHSAAAPDRRTARSMRSPRRSHRRPAETASSPAGSIPNGRARSRSARGGECRAGPGQACGAARGRCPGACRAPPRFQSRATLSARPCRRAHKIRRHWSRTAWYGRRAAWSGKCARSREAEIEIEGNVSRSADPRMRGRKIRRRRRAAAPPRARSAERAHAPTCT